MIFTTGKLRQRLSDNRRRQEALRGGVDPGQPSEFAQWLLDVRWLPPMLHQAKRDQEELEELVVYIHEIGCLYSRAAEKGFSRKPSTRPNQFSQTQR